MNLPTCLADLAGYRRWVGWRWVTLPSGKRDKPPMRLDHPEFGASTARPEDWGLFVAGARHIASGQLNGLGYVTAEDRERVFLDLDDCRNPTTGVVDDWAAQLVEAAGSYTEITPSGCGLRIIGLAGSLAAPIHTPYRLPNGGHGEVYFRAVRYVTVTGDRLPGTPDELRDIGDVTLDLLAAAGRQKAAEAKPASRSGRAPFGLDLRPPIEDVASALAEIPNADVEWDDWIRIGLAVFRATDGSVEGREAWRDWSAKSAKHDDATLDERWHHFGRSPPSRIGFGSLHHAATEASPDWVPPSWRPAPEEGAPGGPFDAEDPFAGIAEPPKPKELRRLPKVRFEEWTEDLDAADFVEGLLTLGAMSVLYGESNAGKTFLATDIGLHVAAGLPWHGRAVDRGGVVYLAMEGRRGIGNRVAAWKRRHHYTERTDVPFTVIPTTINLLDAEADVPALIEAIREEAAYLGVPIALVEVDTLARAMGGGNENSSEDMGRLVAAGDAIREATGAHVLFIHHSGKDASKGSRGHSSLRAALDTEIEIVRPEGEAIGAIKIRKQRDLEKEGDTHFRLDIVELGMNRRGKPVTSCVVVPVLPEEARSGPRYPAGYSKLTDAGRIGFAALLQATNEAAQDLHKPAHIAQNVCAVPVRAWRDAHDRVSTAPTDNAKRVAFDRAAKNVQAQRCAVVVDGWAWILWPAK